MIIWPKKCFEEKLSFPGKNKWWDNNKVLKISLLKYCFYCVYLYRAHCTRVRKALQNANKKNLLRVKLQNYCNFDVDEAMVGVRTAFQFVPSMRWCLIWFQSSSVRFSNSSLCRWCDQEAPKKWFGGISKWSI